MGRKGGGAAKERAAPGEKKPGRGRGAQERGDPQTRTTHNDVL